MQCAARGSICICLLRVASVGRNRHVSCHAQAAQPAASRASRTVPIVAQSHVIDHAEVVSELVSAEPQLSVPAPRKQVVREVADLETILKERDACGVSPIEMRREFLSETGADQLPNVYRWDSLQV